MRISAVLGALGLAVFSASEFGALGSAVPRAQTLSLSASLEKSVRAVTLPIYERSPAPGGGSKGSKGKSKEKSKPSSSKKKSSKGKSKASKAEKEQLVNQYPPKGKSIEGKKIFGPRIKKELEEPTETSWWEFAPHENCMKRRSIGEAGPAHFIRLHTRQSLLDNARNREEWLAMLPLVTAAVQNDPIFPPNFDVIVFGGGPNVLNGVRGPNGVSGDFDIVFQAGTTMDQKARFEQIIMDIATYWNNQANQHAIDTMSEPKYFDVNFINSIVEDKWLSGMEEYLGQTVRGEFYRDENNPKMGFYEANYHLQLYMKMEKMTNFIEGLGVYQDRDLVDAIHYLQTIVFERGYFYTIDEIRAWGTFLGYSEERSAQVMMTTMEMLEQYGSVQDELTGEIWRVFDENELVFVQSERMRLQTRNPRYGQPC